MDALLTLVGLVLVILGLRDIYHSLIHPSGKGALSHGLMYSLWRISYATGHRLGPVGPGAMAAAGYAADLPQLDPAAAGRTLESVADDVGQLRIGFTQHTETYYFREDDPELALACQLPYALTLRDSAAASENPQLRAGARVLLAALDQLAAKLDHDFLHTDGTPEEVAAAYARDHAGSGRRSG
ncbi:hypothetical protein FQ377_02110 [Arthrobacter echini]|uniref:Uncharacterized protein n=1 Tax=Arthrobacter echini TaxID=1529066 RepID=A0A5D0XUB0_9MICC|nr:hypothetical protein [Arthrobacter echini]TYD00276.1 hypothetical protein FQ377_02110 [Arthrobacter echini]